MGTDQFIITVEDVNPYKHKKIINKKVISLLDLAASDIHKNIYENQLKNSNISDLKGIERLKYPINRKSAIKELEKLPNKLQNYIINGEFDYVEVIFNVKAIADSNVPRDNEKSFWLMTIYDYCLENSLNSFFSDIGWKEFFKAKWHLDWQDILIKSVTTLDKGELHHVEQDTFYPNPGANGEWCKTSVVVSSNEIVNGLNVGDISYSRSYELAEYSSSGIPFVPLFEKESNESELESNEYIFWNENDNEDDKYEGKEKKRIFDENLEIILKYYKIIGRKLAELMSDAPKPSIVYGRYHHYSNNLLRNQKSKLSGEYFIEILTLVGLLRKNLTILDITNKDFLKSLVWFEEFFK